MPQLHTVNFDQARITWLNGRKLPKGWINSSDHTIHNEGQVSNISSFNFNSSIEMLILMKIIQKGCQIAE